MLHGAVPSDSSDKEFRLIYSFVLRDQFDSDAESVHNQAKDAFIKFRELKGIGNS